MFAEPNHYTIFYRCRESGDVKKTYVTRNPKVTPGVGLNYARETVEARSGVVRRVMFKGAVLWSDGKPMRV